MVPSGTKFGTEQLNILALAYADDIALIGKKLNRNKNTVCRNAKHCQKVWTTDKPRKDIIYDRRKEK
jgi:hypothetical protein